MYVQFYFDLGTLNVTSKKLPNVLSGRFRRKIGVFRVLRPFNMATELNTIMQLFDGANGSAFAIGSAILIVLLTIGKNCIIYEWFTKLIEMHWEICVNIA